MTKPLLFTPLAIREATFKNRVVIAPMATYSAIDGIAQDWHLAHLGRFALGGAGCVVVEATAVTPEGRITNGDVGLWSDAHTKALKPIAAFMKAQGALPAIQLGHAGRKGAMQRPWFGNGPLNAEDFKRGEKQWPIVSATSEPMAPGYLTPHAMTPDEIGKLVQQWAEAAKRAVEAGFEMIEIHNAHGYLVHQFLSPLSNKRNDGYGGDFAGRTRFPLEITEAIRKVIPQGMPLFVRISAVDGLDGGWTLDDSVAYAKELKARGVDVIDCSSGGLMGSATAARVKRTWGFQVPYADRIRREADIKSMAVGLIVEPAHAEDILQKGQADLVAIAREALVNPCWPQMAELALGRPMTEALDDWTVQYGWWLKLRERSIADIRADEAAAKR